MLLYWTEKGNNQEGFWGNMNLTSNMNMTIHSSWEKNLTFYFHHGHGNKGLCSTNRRCIEFCRSQTPSFGSSLKNWVQRKSYNYTNKHTYRIFHGRATFLKMREMALQLFVLQESTGSIDSFPSFKGSKGRSYRS